ncbi:PEP-CTERM sorting domain-containing protein [Singulisphaera sp. PoT]|uniref:PEP-CTERM sorting domain-containing protein n=1 Tax=Singulisphaera sp. PoT TaxID=3411797 RepID=UPI003BF49062
MQVSVQGNLGNWGVDQTSTRSYNSDKPGQDDGAPLTLFSGPYTSYGLPTPTLDSSGNQVSPGDPTYQGPYYTGKESGTFSFDLTLKPLSQSVASSSGSGSSSGAQDSATIHYTGVYSGQFMSMTLGGEISGGLGGQASTADLKNWSPSSTIPMSVIQPWLDPKNIVVHVGTSGNPANVYATLVRLAGDPNVPEPSTLAFATLVLAGTCTLKWRSRRRRPS